MIEHGREPAGCLMPAFALVLITVFWLFAVPWAWMLVFEWGCSA